MKPKKAEMNGYLIGLILVLVLIVAFTPIYLMIKGKTAEGSIREIRRQNVKTNANAHIAGIYTSSDLNFPIIKLDVKKGEEFEKISEALVHDWQDLLKAERELFDTKTEEIIYCIPGHYLTFKDKKELSTAELANYQSTHKTGIIGDKSTISQYLTGYSTDNDVFEQKMSEVKQEYNINTNYGYMTVTVYMKKGYWEKWLSSVFGTGIGATTGFVLGVVLVPFTGGGSLVISGLAVAGGAAGGVIGYKTGSDKSADWDAAIFFVPNKEDALRGLKCNALPATGDIK